MFKSPSKPLYWAFLETFINFRLCLGLRRDNRKIWRDLHTARAQEETKKGSKASGSETVQASQRKSQISYAKSV